jgi:hypothetical protein
VAIEVVAAVRGAKHCCGDEIGILGEYGIAQPPLGGREGIPDKQAVRVRSVEEDAAVAAIHRQPIGVVELGLLETRESCVENEARDVLSGAAVAEVAERGPHGNESIHNTFPISSIVSRERWPAASGIFLFIFSIFLQNLFYIFFKTFSEIFFKTF